MAPRAELAGLIQHFWIVRWDLAGGERRTPETLPHPNVHLVLEPGASRLCGVHTGRFTTVLEGSGGVFGVKFRPGGFRPFLQRSVSTLRNRMVPPQTVLGDLAAALEAEAYAVSPDDTAMVAAAERLLLANLPPPDPEVDRVAAIVDVAAADRAVTRVEHLVERSGVPLRALQRLFTEYVGVGAKWVVNRYRLHEAVERLNASGAVDWAGLALELGYFDQAHFIRDFRAMTGRTPGQYVRTTRTVTPRRSPAFARARQERT